MYGELRYIVGEAVSDGIQDYDATGAGYEEIAKLVLGSVSFAQWAPQVSQLRCWLS